MGQAVIIGLFVFLMSSFLSSLYILENQSSVGCVVGEDLYTSVSCCLGLLAVFFALKKTFIFMSFHLLIIDLRICAAGILFRK